MQFKNIKILPADFLEMTKKLKYFLQFEWRKDSIHKINT